MEDQTTYTPKEFAALIGVTTRTIKRWLGAGHIREPRRHPRTKYRLFTEQDVHDALLYKNEGVRPGEDRQLDLHNSHA